MMSKRPTKGAKHFWPLAVGALGGVMALAPLFLTHTGNLRAQDEGAEATSAIEEEETTAQLSEPPAECTFFTRRPLHSQREGDEQSFGDEGMAWSASVASQQTQLVTGQLPNIRGGRTLSTGGPYLSRIDY